MRINVGTVDRVVGAVFALALVSLASGAGIALFDAAPMKHHAIPVAVVGLVVTVARICPAGSVSAPATCRG